MRSRSQVPLSGNGTRENAVYSMSTTISLNLLVVSMPHCLAVPVQSTESSLYHAVRVRIFGRKRYIVPPWRRKLWVSYISKEWLSNVTGDKVKEREKAIILRENRLKAE
jgi:hypothetical protein